MATIAYVTTGSSSANTLPEVADYLLWYAKDKNQVKYRQLYEPLTTLRGDQAFQLGCNDRVARGSEPQTDAGRAF